MLQSLECGVQELQKILSIGVPFVVPSVFLDLQLDLEDVRDKPSSPSVTHLFASQDAPPFLFVLPPFLIFTLFPLPLLLLLSILILFLTAVFIFAS